MSVKISFSYCLLQYKHDPWLQERMNIGILMYAKNARFLRFMSRGWEGRITAAYPNLDKAAFTEDLKQISRSIEKFSRQNVLRPNLLSSLTGSHNSVDDGFSAQSLAAQISSGSDSSYTWAEGGFGVCSNLDDRLESLFKRFVLPYEKEKTLANRSDDQVWSEIARILTHRDIYSKIDFEPRIQTELGSIKFHAGYQNGKFHAIQPLSFDLFDEDSISAKAGKWGGFAQAVKGSSTKRDVVTQFVVGRPRKDCLLNQYTAAMKFLANIAGTENVIDENRSAMLVDQIESDLKEHPSQ